MVLNVTINNSSVILWRSVLLVEETRVPGEHHRPRRKSINKTIQCYNSKPIEILK